GQLQLYEPTVVVQLEVRFDYLARAIEAVQAFFENAPAEVHGGLIPFPLHDAAWGIRRSITVAISFIHRLSYADLPNPVIAQAKRCLLDLIGVAASGRQPELSRIVHRFAVSQKGASGTEVRLLFDGRRASPAGAAYADASTIDAFDAHDGLGSPRDTPGLPFCQPPLLRWTRPDGGMDASC
ncbi:MmgE/PrpD family protein, partial [Microvirga aerophila]|uniref:MmgE/PrpD family protein n=1 Tax=Microvirga aerophila TaxID=670291 RepID=UPI001AED590F